MKIFELEYERVLQAQREAVCMLQQFPDADGRHASLGLSDWVKEEVLMLLEHQQKS